MTSLPEAMATFLQERGFGSYRNSGAPYSNNEVAIALEAMPAEPPRAICITQYAGVEADSKLPWDEPRLQIRVRGDFDPMTSRDTAQEIYDLLHGLGPQTLSTVRLQLVIGIGSGPELLRLDENRRFEHVVNFEVTMYNPNRRS
jgi:Bacteriophage minor capsid protein